MINVRPLVQSVVMMFTIASLGLVMPATAFADDIVKLNEDGITAFQAGQFEEAASKFQQAYEIKPEPPLKKNEALAWFKAGECGRALSAAGEYLALGVEDDRSQQEAQTVVVRCHLQRAEAALAAGELADAEAALADARAHEPGDEDVASISGMEKEIASRRAAEQQVRQDAIAAAQQDEQREAREQSRRKKRSMGLGIASAGGAIVLGTLIYHVALATGTSAKFRDAAQAGDRAEYDRLGQKLETANWLVPALYGVGLATAGVGGYIWWSASPADQNTTPAEGWAGGIDAIGFTATMHF